MKFRFVMIVALLCAALCLAAGCAGEQPEEEMYTEEIPVNAQPMRDTVVYFAGAGGKLVPVVSPIEWSENMQAEALKCLTVEAPEGLANILPEGTEATLYISGGLAVADFPAAAFEAADGAEEARKLIAIVNTLTGFDNVERVVITVDGVSSVKLPHGTDLSGTFTAFDINPQKGEGNAAVAYYPSEDLAFAVPVTVYLPDDPTPGEMVEMLLRAPETEGVTCAFAESELSEYAVDASGRLTLDFSKLGFADGCEEAAIKTLLLTCLAFDNITDIDILVEGEAYGGEYTLPVFANTYE